MEYLPNRNKRRIPTEVEGIGKLRPYLEPGKRRSKYITGQTPSTGKLVPSLRAAIEKVGLKDGMTISFHHHLRNGDLVLPQVMAELAAMGIRADPVGFLPEQEPCLPDRLYPLGCHHWH